MLSELLGEIIKRVETSDDRWPLRRNLVVCGCVCKRWREVTREIVKPPVHGGKITFPSCLKQDPVGKSSEKPKKRQVRRVPPPGFLTNPRTVGKRNSEQSSGERSHIQMRLKNILIIYYLKMDQMRKMIQQRFLNPEIRITYRIKGDNTLMDRKRFYHFGKNEFRYLFLALRLKIWLRLKKHWGKRYANDISSEAHIEVMRKVKPEMKEYELES